MTAGRCDPRALHPDPWAELPRVLRRCGAVDQVELKIQLDQVELSVDAAASVLGMQVVRRRSHSLTSSTPRSARWRDAV
jgi:hypothetical protein